MHFITFPVASTNIFPLVNSKQGGQLVTEFNLKSRETVITDPNIKYVVGPSYIHSPDDFKVKLLEDTEAADYDPTVTYAKGDYCRYNNDTYICISAIHMPEPFNADHWAKSSISTSILQIDPGRAVINGHYVESLAPIIIDLNLANAELARLSEAPLYGNLSIGIKSYFSTELTMSGSMYAEEDNMYIGVQIVIENAIDFKVPGDEGCRAVHEQSNVTADIKLADFAYINGNIPPASIIPNPNATRFIPSDRIYDFDSVLNSTYVTKTGLQNDKFYTFSGKSKWWCNSTGSIMVWDKNPATVLASEYTPADEASFVTNILGQVYLKVPHKQMDGDIYNDQGQKLVYTDKNIPFPVADYSAGTSGAITKEYTQHIKDMESKIATYKEFINGKQIHYLERLNVGSNGKLNFTFPTDLSHYNVGDYILVREDYTVYANEDISAAPSTMYFVLPGGVTSVLPDGITTTLPAGVQLGIAYELSGDTSATPSTTNPTAEELAEYFNYTSYKGNAGVDYFALKFTNKDTSTTTTYYYPVTTSGMKSWSDAVLLTGGIPLATEVQVGGFYNASSDTAYEDAGYVYLDNTGHLRLRDYALLRTGVLAYQLGESIKIPNHQTIPAIQEQLDEKVNERIAFVNNALLTSTPTMIDIFITLPANESDTLNIYDIDSRFGTGVYLHFLADDDESKVKNYSNIIINISNCEKIRIDSSITAFTNGPMINLFRTCLYYDAQVLNYIATCDPTNRREALFPSYNNFIGFDGLTLWYERFTVSDPDLTVNGMEVSSPNVNLVAEDINFWSETINDDNHYGYALRSITLSGYGKIVSCSLYITNVSSYRLIPSTGHSIIAGEFKLPQGSALNYPEACLRTPLKVTGTFTTAYLDDLKTRWITSDTSFTALTGAYVPANGTTLGTIAFNSNCYYVPTNYTNVDILEHETIDGWKPGEYHIFYGGTIATNVNS